MKIGIYDPYLDALGGGEKYILTIASFLAEKGTVDVFWDKSIRSRAETITGIDLSKISFVNGFQNTEKGLLSKIKKLRMTLRYDLFFYVTDGSLFFSLAKKSFLVVQVPQQNMYFRSLATFLKLKCWKAQLCYSFYVKKYIEKWWRKPTFVLPPAIQTEQLKPESKEKIILAVGRFFPLPHSKKQQVMVDVFKKMIDGGLKNWRLVLIGGVDEQGQDYLQKIKKTVGSYPVEFKTNISFNELHGWYSRATMYWHAAGFGEDLEKFPERAEHFGMTTLEAMASGCVPLVFPAGGQRDVIQDGENGIYWYSTEELAEKSMTLIKNEKYRKNLALAAQKRSRDFSEDIFQKKLFQIIDQT